MLALKLKKMKREVHVASIGGEKCIKNLDDQPKDHLQWDNRLRNGILLLCDWSLSL